MNRICFAVGALLMMCLSAQAKPRYLVDLRDLYPTSRLTSACNLCHTVGNEFTTYGHDFIRLKERLGPSNMNQVWCELALMDSMGDGLINSQRLLLDAYPTKP